MRHPTLNASPQSAPGNHFGLISELLVLFVILPLAFRFKPFSFPPIPALWLMAAYCWWRLRRDPTFDHRLLWNAGTLSPYLLQIMAGFALTAIAVGIVVYRLRPDLLFNFVTRAPLLWAVVMILYPILSVYPQGIIYRAFFFQRYHRLFPAHCY